MEQNIIALASLMQSNYGSLKKLAMHIGQLDHKVKQGFKASKNWQNRKHHGSHNNNNNNMNPSWKYKAPTDLTKVKTFNNKEWYWCGVPWSMTLVNSLGTEIS